MNSLKISIIMMVLILENYFILDTLILMCFLAHKKEVYG